MSKPKQSSVGTFGAFIIALGIIIGALTSDLYVAACGISAGIGLCLYALLIERLDVIIDLLKQIVEHKHNLQGENDKDKDNSKEK